MSRPTGFGSGRTPGSVRTQAQRREESFQTQLQQVGRSLTPQQLQIFQENPHIQQVFACGRDFLRKDQFTLIDRVLFLDRAPQSPYQRRTKEIKTTLHVGQRKLLLVEIEFLVRYAQVGDVVIYAGAAPGTHHRILDPMFPFLDFVLYDPYRFSVDETEQRELHQEFFTDQTAEQLATRFQNRRILFMSDIRRFEETLPDADQEQLIREDMMAQMIWLNILNPVASLLKMRPPYEGGITQYFDGWIYTQPWVGATSSESRLQVVDRFSRKDYDNKQYEDVFFYHNTMTRTTYFDQIEGVEETTKCHCYDCSAELFILGQYIQKFGNTYVSNLGTSPSELAQSIAKQFP